MNNTYLQLAAILLIANFSTIVKAQTSAKKTTEAGAVLVMAMSLTESTPLHFGSSALTSSSGGSIVLPSNSTALIFNGGVGVAAATPTATNASFQVTGTPMETYSLTLPTTTTLSHTTTNVGVTTMEITQMTARFHGANADGTTSSLSAAGTDSFTLGGTLHVGPNQVAGVYAGTFVVTVEYN